MYSVERWIVTVAKILDIKIKFDSPRYKIIFFLENPTMAKQYEISLLGFGQRTVEDVGFIFKRKYSHFRWANRR